MNTTVTSEPTQVTEVPLTRAAKEELLRQMYTRAHWIELIRLIGYQTVPMDKARQAIIPLADRFGKERLATACEVLVEIFTQDKEAFARLKPHVRRMAFQILGPEPSPGAAIPQADCVVPTSDPPSEMERPKRVEPSKARKPAKRPAPPAEDSIPTSSDGGSAIMQQYRAAKEKHPDMLLLFRIGDFYELFDQDAEVAHKLLGLTLTTRDRTISMAGFPHHQLETYLHKLLKEGQRVAVCEQVEESLARGPIRREVTRVVTSGPIVEEDESETGEAHGTKENARDTEGREVRQPRHFVLQQCAAWLNEAGMAFVAGQDMQRTNPAVAPHVGVLDFIVLRGDDKLLVTVRPHLQAKHLNAFRELQILFGSEYKPIRMWPREGPEGWTWHDHPVDVSTSEPAEDTAQKARPKRPRADKRR